MKIFFKKPRSDRLADSCHRALQALGNLNVIFSFCREINGEFYHPPHVEIQTEKRALPVDIIRAIANLPDNCS